MAKAFGFGGQLSAISCQLIDIDDKSDADRRLKADR
jgi:hypothetical protein